MIKTILSILFFSFLLSTDNPDFSASRPGNTNPSSTLAKGHFMFEGGTDLINDFDSYIQLRYGLLKKIEVSILQPIDSSATAVSGSASIAFSIINGTKILPALGLYVTANDFSDFKDISFYLPFSFSLPQDYNIGGQIGTSTDINHMSYSIYFGKNLNRKVWTFIEIYGMLNINDNQENSDYLYPAFDCGITYMVKENFQLDMNVGLPFTGEDISSNTQPYLQFGAAWMFPFNN
tara:strand:+ start:78 stop:779 length:702 start_codon:yes stop_codon:yes gene_type:complete